MTPRPARGLSLDRFLAIVVKEFIQMRRDRMTFGMMIGIPIMQLVLFGFAINSDPRNLPTAVYLEDPGPFARRVMTALEHTRYFRFTRTVATEQEARDVLARGEVQFVVTVPRDFDRTLLRGEHPQILVEADATDPAATSAAVSALRTAVETALDHDIDGPLAHIRGEEGPVRIEVHALYNPEGITQYNIVSGLLGVVLTLTMVLITALAITREQESGTLENLLAMPTRPLEVMVGKIVPYVFVGYVQVSLILLIAHYVFRVPIVGSLSLLLAAALVFIFANLAMGITFSTIARNQRQAMQMGMFFFLPSMLLSGFMFPFRGMPIWAQRVGEMFPLTPFLRICRGILLKGNGPSDIAPHVGQIALFAAIALAIGVTRYRRTLD